MMRVGTSHFLNLTTATAYYARQGLTGEDVRAKLREGEIFIGEPVCQRWERVGLDFEGRYWVQTKLRRKD